MLIEHIAGERRMFKVRAKTRRADMATVKCQHPTCACHVKDRNYCSEKCETAPKSLPGKCPCNHLDCKGSGGIR